MNKEIYLDHAASAPITTEVLKYLSEIYAKKLGNSSSIHRSGVMANLELEKARIQIANKINCNPEEIIFTSGATESNNLALLGIANTYLQQPKNEIIISAIEHSSIIETSEYLKAQGFKIHIAPVNSRAEVDLIKLEELITPNTLLISIIHANNELGVIQNLVNIGKLCKKYEVLFHSDGAQAFCKTLINVKEMSLDLYSISGHKIHGPKGVGALYIKTGQKISALSHGGVQENSLRAGTVPVELCSTMAYATNLYTEENMSHLKKIKNILMTELKIKIPPMEINSKSNSSLPNIFNFRIPGILAKTLLKELDSLGVRVSVGSACNSGKKEASNTLLAIGLSETQAFESIRVSWGLETSEEDIYQFIKILGQITDKN